ncbi:MAG: glycosyltransferase [Motiliproteus sp.]
MHERNTEPEWMTVKLTTLKKALIISSLDWESPIRVGTHHIAKTLVDKGWQVGFLSFPISPFHRLAKNQEEYQRRCGLNFGGEGVYRLNDSLWTLVPWALAVPRKEVPFNSSWMFRHWYRLSHQALLERVCEAGFGDVDLLYFDNPYQNFWLDKINYNKSVLRIADANHGFDHFCRQAESFERELANRVDLVVCSSTGVCQQVRAWTTSDVRFMPNGVDLDRFSIADQSLPADLTSIPQPIVLYVGSVNYWFNFTLVQRCAQRMADVSFVIVGPCLDVPEELNRLENVHFLGRKNHAELAAYLGSADVGIIPFDYDGYPDLVNSINPLKLYEYLACGLPVVSVAWRELKLINPPILYANDSNEFIDALSHVLATEHDPAEGLKFVASKGWGSIIDELLSMLNLSLENQSR